MGNTCRYSSRSRPAPSKMDLSRYLLAMNNRLRPSAGQRTTGSQLGVGPPSPPATKSVSPPSELSSAVTSALELGEIGMAPDGMHHGSTMVWPDLAIDNFNFNLDNMTSLDYSVTNMSPLNMQDAAAQHSYFDPMLLDPSFSVSPTSTTATSSNHNHSIHQNLSNSSLTIPGLSPSLMQGLYDRYFDLFHPIMPMISRRRFFAEVASPSPSHSIQALSSAMAALGSLSVPELHHHVDKCYEQTRTILDLCERQGDTGESFANMNTLQALTLLIMFEFKQPNFARAWMTLGRAIRLAKMMGLDLSSATSDSTLNSGASTPTTRRMSKASSTSASHSVSQYTGASWGARLRLPPATDAADVEERRRTFWALFVFEAFSATQTNEEVSALDRPMHIPLPSPGLYPDEILETKFNMPSMHQILDTELSTHVVLSSFAGTIVMVCLYRRCIEHIKLACFLPLSSSSPTGTTNNNFWERHYALDKAITHVRSFPLSRHVDPSSTEPRSLAVRINLSAVEISLHEMALVKVQEDKLPGVLAVEAMNKCTAAASDIAKAVQIGRELTGRKLKQFKTHDRFLIWPMMTAIQICSRMLGESGREGSNITGGKGMACGSETELLPNHLRVLSGAMEELIPADKMEAWVGSASMGGSAAGSLGGSPE
ncbi:fungal-specific transcription factor domain-containing protein [Podospora australis]|uniref:Fungal-specific transcription factor domain-containing protein n=1 Tax=Podospora australis TaxID=1536484 RepID=A0AAN7AEB3_9PEZI|nr:fungal-specific transcription factor domain-containing protein [Podospora australis]